MVCQSFARKLLLTIFQVLLLVSFLSTGIDAVENSDPNDACQSQSSMQMQQRQQQQQRSGSENQTTNDVCGSTSTSTTATTLADVAGTLFLAPSSIPGAGLGVYTIVDIPECSIVGESDLFVVIEEDDDHKVLPYRGQQRFLLSWLAYAWPRKPDALYPTQREEFFPDLPKSFRRFDKTVSVASTRPDRCNFDPTVRMNTTNLVAT
jgi:hypothetical protein